MRNLFSSNRIGVMQGRIAPRETKKYQSFPFKNWVNEFKHLKKLKIKKIEWLFSSNNFERNPIFSSNGLKLVKKNLKKYNLSTPSLIVDYIIDNPFFKKKYQSQKKIILHTLNKIIKNSKKLKIKYIIFPLLEGSSLRNSSELKIFKAEMKKFLPILKKNNQAILFETNLEPKKNLNLIKYFNKKYFGINYDMGNSAGNNFSPLDEKIFFSFVKNVHIKDKTRSGKTVRLGLGKVDFKLIFRLLRKYKYKGNFIFETARAKENQVKEIDKNLNFLQNL